MMGNTSGRSISSPFHRVFPHPSVSIVVTGQLDSRPAMASAGDEACELVARRDAELDEHLPCPLPALRGLAH